jgi:hypothetical protein
MREYGAFRYPGYYTYIMIAANEGLLVVCHRAIT